MARQSTDTAIPVLLTRPMAQAQSFALALTARFGDRVRPVIAPLLDIEYLSPDLRDMDFSGVIFTSAHGVEAATRLGLTLPKRAYCVGTKTAAAAEAAGFVATSADGDADALVAALLANPPPGRLLHLRGEDTRGAVADRLVAAGLETAAVVVYRQTSQPISKAALELLQRKGVVVAPLFSPRSANLFSQAVPPVIAADLRVTAMSDAVAKAVSVTTERLVIARRPDAEAMLDAVGAALKPGSAS